ncbi:putative bifunctional diguanylate cyclase/phosphodiesterase [Massilia sp. TSP1-1-2]|uniref:putative bifunctional diguanylate cyclase/phosphodiesterase n=1 Tax=Massilia sp. TSP1-1-2 TaxID=2804649 RepID=UPI003CF6D71E
MDDVPRSSKCKLPAFIRDNIESILVEWEAFAKGILSARHMDEAALRDDAGAMLRAIADDLEQPQTSGQQFEKSRGRAPPNTLESAAERHGSARVASGFSLDETISEFRALRASVLKQWACANRAAETASSDEALRFNEAIDQALTESLERYALDKDEHTRRFDTLLSSSPDLQFILDIDAHFLYANITLAKLFNAQVDAILGKPIRRFCRDLAPKFERDIAHVVDNHESLRGEFTCHADQMEPVTYRYVLLPVINEAGVVESVTGSARNISELKASENKLLRNAYYDSLTELPNRMLFRDRLEQEVRYAGRTGLTLALLFVDLDGFKGVNDRFGHAAGDQVLRESARRIGACVRASDTVARLGGDEFTVIITDVRKIPHIEVLAQQILASLGRPIALHEHSAAISGSIGITLYPQDALLPDDLLRNADQAMFVAKKAGRNRFSFFTKAMRDSAWARLRVIDELREAIACHQLAVYYQPIIDMGTGAIVKAEALVRWHHPQSGTLLPAAFIGLAEETGLIGQIDAWVLQEAVCRARQWSDLLGRPFQVSVNKSPVEFTDRSMMKPGGPDLQTLTEAGGSVAVEVTEGVMLNESPGVREKLLALQQAGVQFAIDDFGIGYSSMSYLKKFNVNFLKIDQSFVKDMVSSSESRIFAETIVMMAHRLGLKVIAEGVETCAQRDWLKAAGCDYAQGFLYSEATSAECFAQMLTAAH